MLDRISEKMNARAAVLASRLDNRLDRVLQLWLLVIGLVSVGRLALASPSAPVAGPAVFASHLLLVVAPVASTLLALRWFEDAHRQPQPSLRLARAGRWRSVSPAEAERHPLYGTGGIMVSLLVGIMLNVPVRAAEYLAAMPLLPQVAPAWLSTLHSAMTFDAVLFSSLYMIAFVAALRRSPLFPRLLLSIWLADLAMQQAVAAMVTAAGPVPPTVAAPLQALLEGNSKKVLISMALWLPYLLLSVRVNLTYRHRVPA